MLKRYDKLAKVNSQRRHIDNLGYAIEAELIKLKSIFNEISTRQHDIEVTEPLEIKQDNSEIYNYLFNKLKNS